MLKNEAAILQGYARGQRSALPLSVRTRYVQGIYDGHHKSGEKARNLDDDL